MKGIALFKIFLSFHQILIVLFIVEASSDFEDMFSPPGEFGYKGIKMKQAKSEPKKVLRVEHVFTEPLKHAFVGTVKADNGPNLHDELLKLMIPKPKKTITEYQKMVAAMGKPIELPEPNEMWPNMNSYSAKSSDQEMQRKSKVSGDLPSIASLILPWISGTSQTKVVSKQRKRPKRPKVWSRPPRKQWIPPPPKPWSPPPTKEELYGAPWPVVQVEPKSNHLHTPKSEVAKPWQPQPKLSPKQPVHRHIIWHGPKGPPLKHQSGMPSANMPYSQWPKSPWEPATLKRWPSNAPAAVSHVSPDTHSRSVSEPTRKVVMAWYDPPKRSRYHNEKGQMHFHNDYHLNNRHKAVDANYHHLSDYNALSDRKDKNHWKRNNGIYPVLDHGEDKLFDELYDPTRSNGKIFPFQYSRKYSIKGSFHMYWQKAEKGLGKSRKTEKLKIYCDVPGLPCLSKNGSNVRSVSHLF